MEDKKFISDIIADEYKEWGNEFVVISAPTGTGKSYFVCNVLAPYYKSNCKTVLYLVGRTELLYEIKNNVPDNVTVMTYQKMQNMYTDDRHDEISKYDLIVSDEAQYYIEDSFNGQTDKALDFMLDEVKKHTVLFISATGDEVFDYIRKQYPISEDRIYTIEKDLSYIDSLYVYEQREIREIVDDILTKEPQSKCLIYVSTITRLKTLHDIFGDRADYLCSKYNSKAERLTYINRNAIKNNTFEKSILVCTKATDAGINIFCKELRHIFVEISDPNTAIQCIGRKRVVDEEDHLSVYIANRADYTIRKNIAEIIDKLEPVRVLREEGREEFVKKFPDSDRIKDKDMFRMNFKDATDGNIGIVAINEIKVAKAENDLAMYYEMLECGYSKYMAEKLGLEDREKPLEFKMDKILAFIEYLESLIGKKLFNIGTLNQDGTFDNSVELDRLKKRFKKMGHNKRTMGINTLSGKLKDLGLPYMITSGKYLGRKPVGESNTILRRMTYWEVVRIPESEESEE